MFESILASAIPHVPAPRTPIFTISLFLSANLSQLQTHPAVILQPEGLPFLFSLKRLCLLFPVLQSTGHFRLRAKPAPTEAFYHHSRTGANCALLPSSFYLHSIFILPSICSCLALHPFFSIPSSQGPAPPESHPAPSLPSAASEMKPRTGLRSGQR